MSILQVLDYQVLYYQVLEESFRYLIIRYLIIDVQVLEFQVLENRGIIRYLKITPAEVVVFQNLENYIAYKLA